MPAKQMRSSCTCVARALALAPGFKGFGRGAFFLETYQYATAMAAAAEKTADQMIARLIHPKMCPLLKCLHLFSGDYARVRMHCGVTLVREWRQAAAL